MNSTRTTKKIESNEGLQLRCFAEVSVSPPLRECGIYTRFSRIRCEVWTPYRCAINKVAGPYRVIVCVQRRESYVRVTTRFPSFVREEGFRAFHASVHAIFFSPLNYSRASSR